MANKKKPQTSIEPDLQAYLDQIAANHQPDQKALQHRIDNAIIRYDATQRVQKFSDKPALLIDKLQQLTIDGWRYYWIVLTLCYPIQRSFLSPYKSHPQ